MTLRNEAAEVMAAAGYENVRMDCDDAVQWELLPRNSWERVRRTGEAKLALTALLAFLAERGLRVVPVEPTERMVLNAIVATEQDREDPSVWMEYREIIRQGIAAAPMFGEGV